MNRLLQAGLLSAALIFTNSCSVMKAELGNPGGYPGKVMDDHFLHAHDNAKVQLFRATLLTAILSGMAVGTVDNGDDKEIFVKRLNQVSRHIRYLHSVLDGETGKPSCGEIATGTCSNRISLFESQVPDLEYSVVELARAALPRKLAAAATQPSAGNVISFTLNLIKSSGSTIDGLHRAAANYRSAMAIVRKMECDPASDSTCQSITPAKKGPDKADFKYFDGVTGIKPASLDDGIKALFDLTRVSCARLQDLDDDPATDDAQKSGCQSIDYAAKTRYGGTSLPNP